MIMRKVFERGGATVVYSEKIDHNNINTVQLWASATDAYDIYRELAVSYMIKGGTLKDYGWHLQVIKDPGNSTCQDLTEKSAKQIINDILTTCETHIERLFGVSRPGAPGHYGFVRFHERCASRVAPWHYFNESTQTNT